MATNKPSIQVSIFWHTQWQNHSEYKSVWCQWPWYPCVVAVVMLEPWKECLFKKDEGTGKALPVHHMHTLLSYCFSLFHLYLLISIISLALPEPFWKWKAGKKKEEEKKKKKGGKKNMSMVPFKVNIQNNYPWPLLDYHRIGSVLPVQPKNKV